MDTPPPGARIAPATARNREPILAVLKAHLPAAGLVLEIAAGTGEHAVHFAAAFPGVTWQPADRDAAALASIEAWRTTAGLSNLNAPARLDASAPADWPVTRADAVVCINMIHIAPWAATEGLMAGAGAILPAGGVLVLYGPFIEDGRPTAASNLAFDADLKARDPAWGLRRLGEVEALAAGCGLALVETVDMPANNLCVVFRRTT